jgi:hypothetical protein
MQDYELTQHEFGEDLEADSFEFEMGDEFEMEANISDAVPLAKGKSIQDAAFAAARIATARQQSGRWVRRGNTVVLFGI